MKDRPCDTCKNNFVLKKLRYITNDCEEYPYREDHSNGRSVCKDDVKNIDLNEIITYNEFCVYTREYENPVECSFCNNASDITKLAEKENVTCFDDDGFQDVNRTFTTSERATSVRFDCSVEQGGALH